MRCAIALIKQHIIIPSVVRFFASSLNRDLAGLGGKMFFTFIPSELCKVIGFRFKAGLEFNEFKAAGT
jgi:hypothetical protein